MIKPSKGLGRGLSALLGDAEMIYKEFSEENAAQQAVQRKLPIEELEPGVFQPRRFFDDEPLKELSQSIQKQGVLQPVLVRPKGTNGAYEIVAGERRWRAAQLAKLHEIPVIIQDLSDSETLEIALVENLQRQDLTVLEEAEAYQALINKFGHTQMELSQKMGKSRSHIANMLRLLTLPDGIKDLVEQGNLSAGHARTLINSENPLALSKKIIAGNLSVRQAEKLATQKSPQKSSKKTPSVKKNMKDHHVKDLEKQLSNRLGLNVLLEIHSKGGRLVIEYQTLDQLDDIITRL